MNKIKISYKLAIMALIPLLGLLFFASMNISDIYKVNHKIEVESHEVLVLTKLLESTNDLVHEIQSERGVVAQFYQSKRYQNEFTNQQLSTDKKISILEDYRNNIDDNFDKKIKDVIDRGIAQLKSISQIRKDIQNYTISENAANDYYTKINELFISLNDDVASHASDKYLSELSKSYANLAKIIESSSLELVLLDGVFYRDQYVGNEFQSLVHLVVKQDLYLNEFFRTATDEQIDFYR